MHNYCVDEIANRLFPGTPVECLKEEIINAVVELTRRMNAASYETTDCMKSQDAKPEWTNITKDERSCQDGPKKPSCPVCGKQVNEFDYNEHKWVAMDRKEYCSVKCSIAGRNMTERRAKCQGKPLADIFAYYGLGPEEGAELLERVR